MVLPILLLAGASFALSWLLTLAMKRLAPRIGFVDKPGHRKIHQNPKPLGGGVAIFWAIAGPMLIALAVVHFAEPDLSYEITYQHSSVRTTTGFPRAIVTTSPPTTAEDVPIHNPLAEHWSGIRDQTPLALGFLSGMLILHVVGLIDDQRALGPFFKLFAQLAVATAFVVVFDVRALTALGYVPSVILTVLWIAGITNAFNFLDNMDGLSAGVAAVCTAAFLITAMTIGQWFVAAMLALLLGALLGFLCFNFYPASIFMGDSGSLLIGFVLGVMTVRTTFLPTGRDWGAGWYVVFAPVIVLAVPLYDMIVVSVIRISRGRSPFVGDTNHFSHRLVARGMSRRTAVLTIYLVTAATSVAAIVLPHVTSTWAAMLIFAQTLLILGVVALLEQHPLPVTGTEPASSSPPPPPPVQEPVHK